MIARKINMVIVKDDFREFELYSSILKHIEDRFQKFRFSIYEARSYENVIGRLEQKLDMELLDLIIVTAGITNLEENVLPTVHDLGTWIRKTYPSAKIILITEFQSSILLGGLIDSMNPEGILVKREVTTESLTDAIMEVLEGSSFYSKTVEGTFPQKRSRSYIVGPLDKLILYYLSRGKLNSELPKYVPLKLSTIEKRKRKLKAHFGVSDRNDIKLILRAKEEGFL